MQTYETVIVVHPRLSDEDIAKFAEETKESIAQGGGEVLGEDKWGRRKLAYQIGDTREGYYLYLKYSADGAFLSKMNRKFRLNEDILRTLTVHAEEPRKSAKAMKKAAKAKPKAAT